VSSVLVPGGRDVRATLDDPDDAGGDSAGGDDGGVGDDDRERAPACVVACPPHPQHGGRRSDRRLRAVSDALVERGVACLRFDYGPWDEGVGERDDAANALAWAVDRYERVGLFGYSFGASVALQAAARASPRPAAVSALAPDAAAADALDAIDCPVQVVVGQRDDTVDWRPVLARARELDHAVETLPADHHFVGQGDRVGAVVGKFLAGHL
jgi:alpha/beta superfamily hydrolase